ncbi:MAG: hypothetical protein MJZ12_01415 [Prevotella sp.]|nr:hypothetical protein [Prevotella sp.]
MKKIMFNDKYGLTKAVLEGRKTQTRRVINAPEGELDPCYFNGALTSVHLNDNRAIVYLPAYKVRDEVAVAQRYSEIKVFETMAIQQELNETFLLEKFEQSKGWSNKMFVNPKYMPHRIRITNIRVERLQNISDEDCLKEGIMKYNYYGFLDGNIKNKRGMYVGFGTAKEAYAFLIDKTCGRGTWDSNPYVFVYDFELIK